MKSRIVVVAKDGKAEVKLGRKFESLCDRTKTTLATTSLASLIRFLQDKGDALSGLAIFHQGACIQAVPTNATYTDEPSVVCHLEPSSDIALLQAKANRSLGLQEMEDFLETMKPCWGAGAAELLNSVKRFTLSKLTKVERSRDNSGNYRYAITMESDKGDFVPPEVVTLQTTMWRDMPEQVMFEFTPTVEYKQQEGEVKVGISMRNLRFPWELKDAQDSVILSALREIGTVPVYEGIPKIARATDEFRFMWHKLEDIQ